MELQRFQTAKLILRRKNDVDHKLYGWAFVGYTCVVLPQKQKWRQQKK